MLKRASSNGMFILTKTLAHQKRRQERCESKRSVKQDKRKRSFTSNGERISQWSVTVVAGRDTRWYPRKPL